MSERDIAMERNLYHVDDGPRCPACGEELCLEHTGEDDLGFWVWWWRCAACDWTDGGQRDTTANRLIREAIRDFEIIAQMVHNAYHTREQRVDWLTWRDCEMASCVRARDAIAALEQGTTR